MFDSKSDYALNKQDQDSIVYSGSDGHVAHITRADQNKGIAGCLLEGQ